jgi:lactoylglutathione lyase
MRPFAWAQFGSAFARQTRVDPARRAYPAMTEIVIDVDDVHATRDRIVEQGIEPTEDLQKRDWGLTDFRVTDPDGYYLRFTGRAS